MFNRVSKNNTINRKDLARKINYSLSSNFYSLEEIKGIKLRKVKKIVKLISKINNLKLTRKEIKEISLFLLSDLKLNSESASKIWSFANEVKSDSKVSVTFTILWKKVAEVFSYRLGKFDLMIN